MKKPTIIEIEVKCFDDAGIEKEFYFKSIKELKEWWRNPYEIRRTDNKIVHRSRRSI